MARAMATTLAISWGTPGAHGVPSELEARLRSIDHPGTGTHNTCMMTPLLPPCNDSLHDKRHPRQARAQRQTNATVAPWRRPWSTFGHHHTASLLGTM